MNVPAALALVERKTTPPTSLLVAALVMRRRPRTRVTASLPLSRVAEDTAPSVAEREAGPNPVDEPEHETLAAQRAKQSGPHPQHGAAAD